LSVQIFKRALTLQARQTLVARGALTRTPFGFAGMKAEGEDWAEHRVGKTIAHTNFVDEKVRDKCFGGRVSGEQQR